MLYWAYWKEGLFPWNAMSVGQFRSLFPPQDGHLWRSQELQVPCRGWNSARCYPDSKLTVSMVLQTPNPTVLSLCQWTYGSWLILVCSSKTGLSISWGVLITSGPSPILVKSLLSCGNRSWQFCMLAHCGWLQGKTNAFVFMSSTLSQHKWYLSEENSFIFTSSGHVAMQAWWA